MVLLGASKGSTFHTTLVIYFFNILDPVTWFRSRIWTSMHDVRPSGSSGESLSPPSGLCLGLRRGSETLGKYFILQVKFPHYLHSPSRATCMESNPVKNFQIQTFVPTNGRTRVLYENGPTSVEVISVGHTNFVVKVELMWVQDPCVFSQVFVKTSDQHMYFILQVKFPRYLHSPSRVTCMESNPVKNFKFKHSSQRTGEPGCYTKMVLLVWK